MIESAGRTRFVRVKSLFLLYPSFAFVRLLNLGVHICGLRARLWYNWLMLLRRLVVAIVMCSSGRKWPVWSIFGTDCTRIAGIRTQCGTYVIRLLDSIELHLVGFPTFSSLIV